MDRQQILKLLRAQIHVNGHIIGAAVGSGMTARYASMGGVDLLLALSAGKYRIMGRSSYYSYLCYGNNNDQVMEMGIRELFPIIRDTPILFGLFASDPFIHKYEYLEEIRKNGFSGVVNYPTVSLIDGKFREALEEDGNTFDSEVEMLSLAHYMGLFTIGFVTNIEEADKMLSAQPDIICVHFGLTKGGFLGAKRQISLDMARRKADQIFRHIDSVNPQVIKMIYAGPANTPIDMQYMYQNTSCQGYIGGSTFDRIPTERAILNTARAFKSYGDFNPNNPLTSLVNGEWDMNNAVEFVKKYIEEHYMQEILLSDLALVSHLSASYLSTKFKRETGVTFKEYLIRFRMNQARKILSEGKMNCREAAEAVGYTDYAQFSKMFKKTFGISPALYRKTDSEEQ